MKIRNLLPGFALAALLALGITGTAQASDYDGDCAGLPSSVSGNVNISDTTCSIGHSVTATGSIFISATSISASDLSAGGGDVNLFASSSITAGAIAATGVASITSSGSTVTTGAVVGPSGISINSQQDATTADLSSTSGLIYLISNNGKVQGGKLSAHNSVTVTSKNDLTTDDVTSTNGGIYVNSSDGEVKVGDVLGHDEVDVIAEDMLTSDDVKSSDGSAYITSNSDDVSVAKVEGKNGSIQVLAYQGKIAVSGTVTGDNTTQVFAAKTTISLQDVVNGNGGDVRIFANTGGAGTAFEIGSGGTNGVTSVHNNDAQYIIYISNGGGDINYSGSDLLQVQNSSGQAGTIILDGQSDGTITLSGDINADGSGGQRSGGIFLFAPEVVANGATLSANSPGQQVGGIALTTNQITDNSGLTINLNGDGPFLNFVNFSITPVDSWSVSAPTDPSQPITFGAFTSSGNNLTITGAGDFAIHADGNNNGLKIWGNDLTIDTATTTITQKGSGNGVVISAWDGASSNSTLTLGGTVTINENNNASGRDLSLIGIDSTEIEQMGTVTLNASGITGGDGGIIYVNASTGSLSLGESGDDFTVKADGSSAGGSGGNITIGSNANDLSISFDSGNAVSASAKGGDGAGGLVSITASSFANGSGASSLLAADAHGTGNGGDITITGDSGDLSIGTSSQSLSLSAEGGVTQGDGGTISLKLYNSNLALDSSGSAATINVTAGGSNSQGGQIDIGALSLTNTSGSIATLAASGNGSSSGGNITVNLSDDLLMDDGAAGIRLLATAQGTGSGGNVDIIANNITLVNTAISVAAGATGDGGTVSIFAYAELDLSGHLSADGGSTSGKGGEVNLTAFQLSLPSASNTVISANSSGADGAGSVSLTSDNDVLMSYGSGDIRLEAKSVNGDGGNVQVIGHEDVFVVAEVGLPAIDVSAGGNGNGGQIAISAVVDLIMTGGLEAKGSGTGNGGTIQLSAATVDLGQGAVDASSGPTGTISATTTSIDVTAVTDLSLDSNLILRAKGGSGSGSLSGTISVNSGANLAVAGTLDVSNSSGSAGFITLSAGDSSNPGQLSITGDVEAKASGSASSGGNITLFYSDAGGTVPVSIASGAIVNADVPSSAAQPGQVTVQNTANASVGASVNGLLSADNGIVSLLVTPAVDALLQGDGQVKGAISILAANNIYIDLAQGSVTIEELGTASQTQYIEITTDVGGMGDILSDGNGYITAPTVVLKSDGNIGSATQKLLTAAEDLKITANAVGSNNNVYIQNDAGAQLVLEDSVSSGIFDLITDQSLVLHSVIAGIDSGLTAHPGYVSLETSAGVGIKISDNAVISTSGGSIFIEGTATTLLEVGEDASIIAFGYNSSTPGYIFVEMGPPIGLIPFPGGMPYFDIAPLSDLPFVGPAVFTANAPTSVANIVNSIVTLYGPLSSSITFDGGARITAITPSP